MAREQILTNRPLPGARLNMSHPLAKGLVGCWLMNENGGVRALDLSPTQAHGTLTGFASPPPRPFNGIKFDGSDDYITCGTDSRLLSDPLMLEVWVKYSSLAASLWFGGTFKSATSGYALANSAAYPRMLFYDTVNEDREASNLSYVVGQWHQVVMTLDGTNSFLYLDTQLGTGYTTAYTSPIVAGTSAFRLGILVNTLGKFSGHLALVRLWSIGKSSKQDDKIKALYLSPYSPYGTPMFI